MFVLVHLLKIETILKVVRLHLHQHIQICELYRFFFTVYRSNRSQTSTLFVCIISTDNFSMAQLQRSSVDLLQHALLCPSGALKS